MLTHQIVDRLCEAGHAVFIVGGAVRDSLCGLDCSDEDLVTNATPEQIKQLFPDYPVQHVGQTFGVTLVGGIEVATMRRDMHQGIGDKCCTVAYVPTIEEDLARRDFTINAMAYCDRSGALIDPHDGRADLAQRLIRFVGDPVQRLREDPNRLIRACRMLAKIEGEFHRDTLQALRDQATFFLTGYHKRKPYIARERIRVEILKAMTLPKPSLFFAALHLIGALQYIFPEMVSTIGHTHGRYHPETVWDHCMLVGDYLSPKRPLLRLAGYLHDIGKPASWAINNNGTFRGHELRGAMTAGIELARLSFSGHEIHYIETIIRFHMAELQLSGKKGIHRLLAQLEGHAPWRDVLRHQIADERGNLKKNAFSLQEIKEIVRNVRTCTEEPQAAFSVRDLAISGRDVIEHLQISAGPLVGRRLKQLFEYVLDEPAYNTREWLLDKLTELHLVAD